MAYAMVVDRRTFHLKACVCDRCEKKLKGLLKEIQGIDSIVIHKEQGKLTISGIVDPHKVLEELQKNKMSVELLREEKSSGTDPGGVHEKRVKDSSKLKHETNIIEKHPKQKKNAIYITIIFCCIWLGYVMLKGILYPVLGALAIFFFFVATSEEEKRLGTGPGVVHEKKNVESGEEKRPVVQKSIRKKENKVEDCICQHEQVGMSSNKWFRCDRCEEEGFGPRHRCDTCDYDFHEECLSLKPAISPDLFPKSSFQISPRPTSTMFCDACGNGIHGDYYKSEAKRLNLHPRCSNLPGELHNRDMKTVFILHKKVSSKCCLCEKLAKELQFRGWTYVSECQKYHFHVCCIHEMARKASKCDPAEENIANSDISKALKKVNLQLMTKISNKHGKKWIKFCKIVSLLFRITVGVLLGDPSVVLVSTVVELLS